MLQIAELESRHFLVTGRLYAFVTRESECPVKLTVDLIGGKWKTLILYYLMRGPQRTGVLLQRISGVSKKMLTQRLRKLERGGLIQRNDYAEVPPRVEYALTPHGESLKPILGVMAAWGARHQAKYRRTTPPNGLSSPQQKTYINSTSASAL
jgi:DNA-binding HxlR family transcriptional regulator